MCENMAYFDGSGRTLFFSFADTVTNLGFHLASGIPLPDEQL